MAEQMHPLLPVIKQDSFVTLHYRITLTNIDATAEHDFLNTFTEKPATIQMGAGQLATSLEEKLLGLTQGTHHIFNLPAGVAYGRHNPDLLQHVSRQLLDRESERESDFTPGDVVEFSAPGGGRYAGVLKELNENNALFDFNHPLAGQAIRFEVKVIGVL